MARARVARRSRPLAVCLALAVAAAAVITALRSDGATFTPPPPFAGFTSRAGVHRAPSRMARQQALQQADMKAGEKVQVLYEGVWYDCDVMDVGDGIIKAKYDDGGDEEEDIDIATRVRAVPEPLKLEKGMRMEVEFEGVWYDCDILEVSKDGTTCTAKYDDGGDEEPDVDVESRIRTPRIKLGDLEVGQKMLGTVVGMPPFGVFVDVGAEKDGLVHISRMSRERVENIEDWVMMGQEIDVWVSSIEDEKLGFTMVEGLTGGGGRKVQDLTPFADLPSDEWFDGVVARTAPFGAFVTVTLPGGESADGLVHISQLKDGFVDSVEDEVSEGQEVKVRVQFANLDDNKMSLSMREGGGFGGGGGMRAPPVDLTPFEDVSEEEWLTGKVARIAPFGAFVEVAAPGTDAIATGLVHITRIREGFVESVEDELEVGQEVQVRVDNVDVDGGKLGLSMKSPDAGYD